MKKLSTYERRIQRDLAIGQKHFESGEMNKTLILRSEIETENSRWLLRTREIFEEKQAERIANLVVAKLSSHKKYATV